ncbi:Hypothetical predicted protein [Podarcis lilfordi]|uniref:Uncharacterized protein n=1 Tax=Podarcis lilfordi TaxID=74358 RepID=A0AA35LCE7_9SAUR|nr:Hypothetical predicted protein [Podarcis lilfordi]
MHKDPENRRRQQQCACAGVCIPSWRSRLTESVAAAAATPRSAEPEEAAEASPVPAARLPASGSCLRRWFFLKELSTNDHFLL